jgi:hypothetical protein
MNFVQTLIYGLEEGKGRVFIRLIPLLVGFGFILVFYDFSFYRGLDDAQSMDNAQLARQIARGAGFTTKFLRPHAVAQLQAHASAQSLLGAGPGELFPADRFPAGMPRLLPDTYNAPGYPCLLAAWFTLIRPQFDQSPGEIGQKHVYAGDRWIPEFNQIFVILTLGLVFTLGRRLFDERVAWISAVAFMLSDTVWQYSATALSTCVLMFLVTAALVCACEVHAVSEKMSGDEESSMAPAWPWALLLGLLLAAACLTRLHLLVLLVPLLLFFIALPRAHPALFACVAVLVLAPATLWFWHTYRVCGNPVGSNLPLLLYGGEASYKDNEIYCTTAFPSYDQLFQDAAKKEYLGFLWHFQRGWDLLGSSPMVVLAIASFLHPFKRLRVRAFQWLVAGCALILIAANNLGSAQPEPVGAWNVVIVLLPALLVIGSAFFFVLLDRLNLQVPLLGTVIVIVTLALSGLAIPSTLVSRKFYLYNFPPYLPPFVNMIGKFAEPDEWVTTDMPWATAWYADRTSLWLPDSIKEFENFHDNVCPTGILLLTPVTLDQSMAELRSGEYKDWYPLVFLNSTPPQFPDSAYTLAFQNILPPQFPLTEHAVFQPAGPGSGYCMWSNRQRWLKK